MNMRRQEAQKQVANMKYYSNLLDKIYEKQSEFKIRVGDQSGRTEIKKIGN